ncbi:MAG: hypothetical protein C0621_09425 [Desulfuromonas sp.]|nr:MAG: hypothetical protein C0621_09425 [Desulfuromonas sp.]
MSKPKILLVDDVDFFLDLERDFLRRTPAEIITARNGQEALDLAREHLPSLIYMDVNMPVMDGVTCCKAIKADPLLCKIPIVMVFATTKDVDNTVVAACGCDGVLNKPVDRSAFLTLGRKYLFDVERREKRVPCQVTVTFSVAGESYQGMSVNISEHGLYIQFRGTVEKEVRLPVSFYLPTISTTCLEVRARVAWVNQGFPRRDMDLPQGFGIELLKMTPAQTEVIESYIERYGDPA